MIKPCSSTHQSGPSSFHPAGATPPACFNRSKLFRRTPLGPGSTGHRPHVCAPLPELAPGSTQCRDELRRNAPKLHLALTRAT